MQVDYTEEVTRAMACNSAVIEKDGTIFVTINGSQDGDSVRAIDAEVSTIIDSLGYKPNIILDVRNTGFPDASARKAIIVAFDEDNYNRMALFGLNESLRVIAVIVLRQVTLRSRTKLCKDEKQARAWLAQSPPTLV